MRGIEHLHPKVQEKARTLQKLCDERGIKLLITETWRSQVEQNALYAQGRTTLGSIVTNCQYPNSPHNWGVAFDFCRNVKGQEYNDSDGFFKTVGTLAKSIGLFWGGDFKSFVDKPHLELASEFLPNNSTATLKSKYGTPDRFKATWSMQTTAPVTATTHPTLKKGDKGDDVYTLQLALINKGIKLQKYGADSDFGVETDTGVRAFQKSAGLTVDGIAGAKTWAALGL